MVNVVAGHFDAAIKVGTAQYRVQNAIPLITASIIMGVGLAMTKVALLRI